MIKSKSTLINIHKTFNYKISFPSVVPIVLLIADAVGIYAQRVKTILFILVGENSIIILFSGSDNFLRV